MYRGDYFADLVGTQGSARADNATSALVPSATLPRECVLPAGGSDFSKFRGKLVPRPSRSVNASTLIRVYDVISMNKGEKKIASPNVSKISSDRRTRWYRSAR